MTILLLSDLHQKHHQIYKDLKPADTIIFAGDFMTDGYHIPEVFDFLDWYSTVGNYSNRILVVGNHDRVFENFPEKVKELLLKYPNITYLENSSVTIDGIKFYGSPYQPWFYNWAFNKQRGPEIAVEWAKIPNDVDVLITHGPPYGYGDKVEGRGKNLGCEELIKKIEEIKPCLNIFGHIHSGSKRSSNEHTVFINASNLDEQYRYSYPPILVEIKREDNKLVVV
jgi:Icc-related predicted phosphoesterase